MQADSKDKRGRTLLSRAAEEGREGVVRLLLERKDVQPNSKDEDGLTPLQYASRGGYEAVVRLIEQRLERTYQSHPRP